MSAKKGSVSRREVNRTRKDPRRSFFVPCKTVGSPRSYEGATHRLRSLTLIYGNELMTSVFFLTADSDVLIN